jgi:hypothetical protein
VAGDLAGIRAWPDLVRNFLGDLCCWDDE